MRVEKETSKRLAETANVINSINGGSIFPTFKTTTEKGPLPFGGKHPFCRTGRHQSGGKWKRPFDIPKLTRKLIYVAKRMLGMIKISADVELGKHLSAEFEDDLLSRSLCLSVKCQADFKKKSTFTDTSTSYYSSCKVSAGFSLAVLKVWNATVEIAITTIVNAGIRNTPTPS